MYKEVLTKMFYHQHRQNFFNPYTSFPMQYSFPTVNGGYINSRIDRLESRIDRLSRKVDNFDRRLSRIERRLGLRDNMYD